MAAVAADGVGALADATLDERLAAAGDRLRPSERLVARYLAERPDAAAFMSALEIADELGVSDATVVRSAQSLGYAGLTELRRELIDTMRRRALEPAVRYDHSLERLGTQPDLLLDQLIGGQIDLLGDARRSLVPDHFRHALGLLGQARRIVVFGLGPSAPLADYFVLCARRIGRPSVAINGRLTPVPEAAMELDPHDVLLMIAYERITPELDLVADLAARQAVPAVLVTDRLALALHGRHAVALTARRGEADMMPTITVPLVIIEALLLGLAGLDRARTMAALDELTRLRSRLGG